MTEAEKKWKAIMDNNISEIKAAELLIIFAKILGFNRIKLTRGFDCSYLELIKSELAEHELMSKFSFWHTVTVECRIPYSSTFAEAIINILSFVEKENHKLIFYPESEDIPSKNVKISISKNSPEFLVFKFECSLRGINLDEVVKNG